MAIQKWNPFQKKEIQSSHFPDVFDELMNFDHPLSLFAGFPVSNRMNRFLNEGWSPAVDVSEEKDHYLIKADLPGMRKEDIQIALENDVLIVRGERKSEDETKEKNYHRVERSYGVFERRLSLGNAVDQERIKASYKDGVLVIDAPKSAQAKARKIEVT